MSTVNFLSNKPNLKATSVNIFKTFFPENQDILVKIHFGEPGNKTALFPHDVAPIIEALRSLGLRPTMIDTLVNYDSPRNNINGYEQVVRDRGFDKLAPFIISDKYVDIKTDNLTVRVCREITEAQNLLVISHVKGHPCAGFGGAIKNYGMGGVMKESKNDIHLGGSPLLNSKYCTGCGTCARLCPAKAIEMVNNLPAVNSDKCWGCSVCVVNCPTKSLTPKVALFDDLLAQGAAACINHVPQKTYYINFIQNITKLCDCESDSGEIIAPDVGVLFSDNPVAIDQASVDLVGKNIFHTANHKDPLLQVEYAQKYTKFTTDYQLIKL